jgi:hypothetical protein
VDAYGPIAAPGNFHTRASDDDEIALGKTLLFGRQWQVARDQPAGTGIGGLAEIDRGHGGILNLARKTGLSCLQSNVHR